MIHPLGVIMDASADNCAAKATGRYKSNQKVYLFCLACLLLPPLIVIIGFYLAEKPLVELASAAPTYVPVVVLVTCTLLINNKVIKDLKGCADVIDGLQIENINLQWELDAYKNKNNELRDRLLESESGRKEAERLAKQYWEMLPEDRRKLAEDQCKLEDSIEEMLELNSPQHTSSQRTSDHSRKISSCPRQQKYPPDVRTK